MSNGNYAAVFGLAGAIPDGADEVHRRLTRILERLNGAPPVAFTLTPSMTYLGTDDVDLVRCSAVIGAGQHLASVVDPNGVVRTDPIGLSRVCWGRRGDVVVVSNCSSVVAAGIGASVDPTEVGVLALVGFLLGDATLYEGVYRLEAGTELQLWGAQPRVESVKSTGLRTGWDDRSGADVLRGIVIDLLSAHSSPLLELSGGLDSRAILAAIPADARPGLRAITIGAPDHPDVRLAGQLAEITGLQWSSIDPGDLTRLSPADLQSATRQAVRRRDHVGNALAAVTLDHAEDNIPHGPRFTGANGEFARGFYYPGFLTDGLVTQKRVRRLVDWRLTTNDGPAARSLRPDVVATAKRRVLERVESLLGDGVRWRAATDEFYLHSRMASWAGPGYSARHPASPALAPFFHPAFLEWARALPSHGRLRELAFARMVSTLDAQLAAVPLDRGVSVSTLAAGGPSGLGRDLGTTVMKAVRKAGQRLRRQGRPPPVAGDLSAVLGSGWSSSQTVLLEETGVFQTEFLETLDERRHVDASTLSLAFNLADARAVLSATGELPQGNEAKER